jgi:oxygen-independent coproporphyrinogen-3 oxidase
MKALEMDELPYEIEILTPENKINERIMTQLRLMEGLDLQALKKDYQYDLEAKQGDELRRIIKDGLANIANGNLILTSEGKLMADGIAASLFVW